MVQSFVTQLPAPILDTSSRNGLGAEISWTKEDNSTEGSFSILRSIDNGTTFNTIDTDIPISTSSYVDTPLVGGQTFIYKVVRDTGDATESSNSISVTTLTPPTQVSKSIQSESSITISWQYGTNTINGFKIYRSLENKSLLNSFTEIASVSASTSTYEATIPTSDIYYYKVSAFDATSESVSESVSSTGISDLSITNEPIKINESFGGYSI